MLHTRRVRVVRAARIPWCRGRQRDDTTCCLNEIAIIIKNLKMLEHHLKFMSPTRCLRQSEQIFLNALEEISSYAMLCDRVCLRKFPSGDW